MSPSAISQLIGCASDCSTRFSWSAHPARVIAAKIITSSFFMVYIPFHNCFFSPLFVRFIRISGGVRLPVSSKSVQRSTLLTERFLRPLFQRLPSADAPSLAVPMETTTRKKGKATHNVTASTKIPVKLSAVRRRIEFMWWSMEIMARYFIMIFMRADPCSIACLALAFSKSRWSHPCRSSSTWRYLLPRRQRSPGRQQKRSIVMSTWEHSDWFLRKIGRTVYWTMVQ